MVEKEEEQELALLATRAEEIRTGLDTNFTEEQLQRPLSRRMVHALVASLTATTSAKLKALSARVAELEAGGVRYSGCYQRALEYRKGSVVTFVSSMWVALDNVPAGVQPGSNTAFWQLAQKGNPSKRVKATEREQ
ncbi:transposase [Rhizobium sp. YTUHZ045]|uniref:transposase n=1 Tax=Rhizobium sp. YTUHZ045 TaxID=2962888 RepID=UPI003DA9F203